MIQSKALKFLETEPANIVTKTYEDALKVVEVVEYLDIPYILLPDFRANYGDDIRSYKDELFLLNRGLYQFYKNKTLIISPINTILRKLPKGKYFKTIDLEFAQTIDLSFFKKSLQLWGYESVNIIQERGEVSFREDIIDIFPINSETPFRIKLVETEIESIKKFDEYTQKSDEEVEGITILPAIASIEEKEFNQIVKNIENSEFNIFYKDYQGLGYWFLEKERIFHTLNLISEMDEEIDEYNLFSKDELNLKFNIIQKDEVETSKLKDFREFIEKKGDNLSLNGYLNYKRKTPTIILDDLKQGDFVVHQFHGIGKFNGLKQIEVLGKTGEFGEVLYANNDKLLLPIENLNLIDRYIGGGGVIPTLDKMGKTTFAKNRKKVEEKIFAIAVDIIKLSAKRGTIIPKPLSFNGIDKFISEAGFKYTKDQKQAVDDIINDMKTRVMDRLLSGDVGFGKTEIAMVSSFIVVNSGYQVVIVAPTTILVSQHFDSFIKRFKSYNVKIEKIDRFTTAKEKKVIEEKLKDGEIDIIIATHSAFGLQYKNLGLVVIDEEHKFGVKQKEKLKSMVENTHLLSMSATPIPRSLNLALSKIKGFSALNTPPKTKKETRTFVKEYNDAVLKEIILREINRGGQVFYIYNNIASIEMKKDALQKLIPNLRVLVLHAKLTPNQIEKNMIDFIDKKYDVIIATTILESGIHIPNVNSVIVENADRFGIADLHQIRGRVGRGKKEGYAYFMVENKDNISENAKKRLLALEENSFLGSGAVLAMHDLEIRGGGNIIGVAQSGQIKNVGYSLYIKMLEDSLRNLSGEEKSEIQQTEIKLNINSYISPEIVADDRIRIEIYRRLSKLKTIEEVYDIEKELIDRFGKVDKVTKNFFEKIKIKIIASKKGIISISNYGENITIIYKNDKKFIKAVAKDDDIILETILKELR